MPTITFLPTFLSPEKMSIEAEPGTSIQIAAEDAGVPMGDACGGNCGCSTCHVHIVEGFDDLEEMEDDEDDVLGKADDVRDVSRLGCQVIVGTGDLVVRITRESQIAFINEHPEHRDRIKDIVT
jgi:2Fe-2S ferredoxin